MQNELDDRSIRALTIVAEGKIDASSTHQGERLVESSRSGAFYKVTRTSCTCPDATFRQATCKHQIALRITSVLATAQLENFKAAA